MTDAECHVIDALERAYRMDRTVLEACSALDAVLNALRALHVTRERAQLRADPSTRTGAIRCVVCGRPAWVDSRGTAYLTCRAATCGEDCRPAASVGP